MGTPAAADAPWSSSAQHACLTWTGGSTGPLLHRRKTHPKAGLLTRAAERREMLWAQRVQGSAGRLSCTLE
eukprot:scaffold5879_cov81-Phaeocystis_antarctica.AAC.1